MKNFIINNNLYLITALGIIVAIITIVNWSAMPVLQRMVSLFFLAIVLHLWEEGKFPGGFTEMITETLKFTASNRHFGEIITASYVLLITLVPLLFPNVAWLSMAPMMLGFLEVVCAFGRDKNVQIEAILLAWACDFGGSAAAHLDLYRCLRGSKQLNATHLMAVLLSLHGYRPIVSTANCGKNEWHEVYRFSKECQSYYIR